MEASSPAADDPGRGVEAGGDVHVAFSLGRVEDDLGALHLPPGKLLGAGDSLQLGALFLAQLDPVAGGACHRRQIQRPARDSFKNSSQYLRPGLLGEIGVSIGESLEAHR